MPEWDLDAIYPEWEAAAKSPDSVSARAAVRQAELEWQRKENTNDDDDDDNASPSYVV